MVPREQYSIMPHGMPQDAHKMPSPFSVTTHILTVDTDCLTLEMRNAEPRVLIRFRHRGPLPSLQEVFNAIVIVIRIKCNHLTEVLVEVLLAIARPICRDALAPFQPPVPLCQEP